jgi:pyrroloquinoline-quinone synthase
MPSAEEFAKLLDRATNERRVLTHPFYEAWAAGELSLEDLALYAAQYWRQVEAFPRYLGLLHDRLPESTAKNIVRANLRDEIDGDHPGLWIDFAATVGIDAQDLSSAPVLEETAACVETFSEACADAEPAYALGMLYGYESQTPEVAGTKIDGLRRHYGIEGKALTYFELHGELDIEHARDLATAAAEFCDGEEAVRQAEAGAKAGAAAIWGLLDGVQRARHGRDA